jgi:hypothetical protein
MIRELLYVVGAPGVGKSTLARELTAGWDKELHRAVPVPHVKLLHPATGRLAGLELGIPRETFSGTDALAMDIGHRALQFLSAMHVSFAFGEGSRLGTRPFIGELARVGVSVTLVRLSAAQDVLDARCRARGSNQNPAWRKGAATRAEKLGTWFSDAMTGFPAPCTYLDLDVSDMTPADVAERVRAAFPSIDLRESAS